MGLTIIEVLENAKYNIEHATHTFQKKLGLNQLSNAIYLLEELEKDPFSEFNEDDLKDKPKY